MESGTLGGVGVTAARGDITGQQVDAIVTAAGWRPGAVGAGMTRTTVAAGANVRL